MRPRSASSMRDRRGTGHKPILGSNQRQLRADEVHMSVLSSSRTSGTAGVAAVSSQSRAMQKLERSVMLTCSGDVTRTSPGRSSRRKGRSSEIFAVCRSRGFAHGPRSARDAAEAPWLSPRQAESRHTGKQQAPHPVPHPVPGPRRCDRPRWGAAARSTAMMYVI